LCHRNEKPAGAWAAISFAMDQIDHRMTSYIQPMTTFLFKCPVTSESVQGWLDDDESAGEDEYEAVTCLACTRLHFVNRKTRKILGHDDERGRDRSPAAHGLR
jgi:hypothetical protein